MNPHRSPTRVSSPLSSPNNSFKILPTRTPHRALSSFMPRMSRSSSAFFTVPAVLASCIAHLDWADAYPLFITCKAMYYALQDDALRDVVLARYVDGYSRALLERQMDHYQRVPVSLHDLDLLLISQRVPLHRYPMHALRVLTSLYPTFDDDELTAKLVAFAQTHSRFVLLLQSMVHSSAQPVPLEPEDITFKPRPSSAQNLRELTFPMPLAYTRNHLPQSSPPVGFDMPSARKLSRRMSASGTISNVPAPHAYGSMPGKISSQAARNPRPSNSLPSLKGSKSKRRLSIFSNTSVALPPREEPRTLKEYSNTWRRGTAASVHYRDNEHGGKTLELPTRRFASTNNSSDSSISDVPIRRDARANSSSTASSSPSLTSPHDLYMATSRVRAPILWTFVPCTKLEDGDQNVIDCEVQLEDAGLWQHLSAGDIVCNMGYVPQTADDSSSEDISPLSLPSIRPRSVARSSRRGSSHSNSGASAPERKWLIFDGHGLVPYTPGAAQCIPVEHPLSLPSPLYFEHIMPPGAQHLYAIARFPVCDDVPQLHLIPARARVPSPHSPEGVALVRRYAWTARVVRLRAGGGAGDVGDGWFGEWVLEHDGTEEGKQALLDALAGKYLGRRCWEVVREHTGGGKLWLRLLD